MQLQLNPYNSDLQVPAPREILKKVRISGSLSYRELGGNDRKFYNATVNGVCFNALWIIKRPDQRVIRFTDHETIFLNKT